MMNQSRESQSTPADPGNFEKWPSIGPGKEICRCAMSEFLSAAEHKKARTSAARALTSVPIEMARPSSISKRPANPYERAPIHIGHFPDASLRLAGQSGVHRCLSDDLHGGGCYLPTPRMSDFYVLPWACSSENLPLPGQRQRSGRPAIGPLLQTDKPMHRGLWSPESPGALPRACRASLLQNARLRLLAGSRRATSPSCCRSYTHGIPMSAYVVGGNGSSFVRSIQRVKRLPQQLCGVKKRNVAAECRIRKSSCSLHGEVERVVPGELLLSI
ncbi:hypothetical protein FKP32DRAFT_1014029 [Trametes sanguinea]|nr:hypothetical protein FKP32DRAFT_1014029 [Trametes sanguinea]